MPFLKDILIDVIIDNFTDLCSKNYRNEIELKGVQFPGQGAPDKINRGSLFALAHESSKISALVPQEHQIRMRSHECEKATAKLPQK